MTSLSGTDLGPFALLAERLQDITEALAATTTQREVIEIVLTPTVQALGAIAGIVLLVDGTDQQMKIAGSQGYEDVTLTVWQEGPIEDHVLIADILQMREARYFEDAGALQEAYPELESRTGALAAVANATLPMFLDEHPLGVIVLDFKEPHHFTPAERRFLKILSAQCAVALGRAEATRTLESRVEERTRQLEERTQQLEEERTAQAAFVSFTETVGSETNLHTLVRQAVVVLQSRFPAASIVYYEEENTRWKGQVWSDDLNPGLVAVISAGLPSDTPLIAEVLRTKQPVFTDVWNAERERVASSEEYGAAANYPLLINGELHSLLSIGLRDTRSWKEADRALVRAVSRGLNLALERTETARQMTRQNVELQARTRALEVFAELTHDLALTTDPLVLIRRALEVVMSMLADGAALYYVPGGDHWSVRVQHGNLHSRELQAAVDAGLSYTETTTLLIPWTTGRPHYQDVYDQEGDHLASLVEHVSATATLPLRMGSVPIGVISFVLFDQRTWTSVDRVVLETAVQSLELALDRAVKTRRLDEERTALEAFTHFTEAVGSETDVLVLVNKAITLLHETCTVDVVYFEREAEGFQAVAWNPQFDATLLPLLQRGFPLQHSGIAQVLRQNAAAFIDHWNDTALLIQETDIFQAVAGYPYLMNGELQRVLIIGSRTSAAWDERTKGIFRAVGHSLDLALDRAGQAETLKVKNAELQARTQALEGFALLSRDFSLEHDPVNLVGRAQELILSLLPEGISTYYELRDDRWDMQSHRGTFQDLALLHALQSGIPRGSMVNLERPVKTRLPHYQDHFDAGTSTVAQEALKAIGATVALPVFVTDQVQGVLVFGLYQSHIWSPPERAVLETVARSLGLALERAQATRALVDQRDALDVQSASLVTANEELQAFSYSVSHDLRTPVRHMLGFLQLARTSLDGKLDERTARYLDVVEQAGSQMNTLIDAMLNLSRAAQQTLRPGLVDLNTIMTQIQATLLPDQLSRNVQWEVEILPQVWGDREMLTQVLSQLTENALKFTQTRDAAVIRVWAEDQGQVWSVQVQDNGLGFDPQYQDRLFNMFQRLHTVQEASGTGVGLASVRRLILKHGGQVFAEGKVGQGATFGFTLPKSSALSP